jgi:hypothetical protein
MRGPNRTQRCPRAPDRGHALLCAARVPSTVIGMERPTTLERNGHWMMAVWALRVGFAAIATIAVGLVVLTSGGTPWVLAAGVLFWLACAVVIAAGFLLTLHDLPLPRPGFWSMRWTIIRDAVGLRVRSGDAR